MDEPAGYLIESIDNDDKVVHIGYARTALEAADLIAVVWTMQSRAYRTTMRTTALYRKGDIPK